MKGLLIKDLKIIKRQKQFFAMVGLLALVFSGIYDNPNFLVSYVTILCGMFASSTISYDEVDNGEAFLFSMPITRKQYVTEKYVFSIIIIGLSFLASCVLGCGAVLIRHLEYSVEEFAGASISSLTFVIFCMAVTIPLYLKYPAEKSRVIYAAIIGGMGAAAYIVFQVTKAAGIDVMQVLDAVLSKSLSAVFASMIAILAVTVIISYIAASKIMENKEF